MARGRNALAVVLWLAFASGLLSSPALVFQPALAAGMSTSFLVIKGSDGTEHRFTVELANTPEQRERGLMYRKNLAPNAGMLFDFEESQVVAFWMRNTLIPLDMLFIDSVGRIVRIAERTVPLSETPISSGESVRAVLELNGGTAARLRIKVGDVVIHPIFKR